MSAPPDLAHGRALALSLHAPAPAANERTFLSWVSMAITIGGVSTALVGFQSEKNGGARPPLAGLLADLPQCHEPGGARGAGHESGPITPATTDLITVLLTPVAILMVIYALFCFYWRSVFMRKKQARRSSPLAAAPRPARLRAR